MHLEVAALVVPVVLQAMVVEHVAMVCGAVAQVVRVMLAHHLLSHAGAQEITVVQVVEVE